MSTADVTTTKTPPLSAADGRAQTSGERRAIQRPDDMNDSASRHAHWERSPIDGVDELSAGAFRAFMHTLHLHRRLMMQALGDTGGHPGQAICLHRLTVQDGLTQRELADTMFLAPPTVSRMLKSMEEAGLVERRPDAGDLRLARVYLTDKGRAKERELQAVTAELVNETLGALSEDDRCELTRLLDELGTHVERAAERRAGRGPGGGAEIAGEAAGGAS